MVTVCLTSCGRLDLLDRTIRSFLDLTKWRFYKMIITDDSGDREVYKHIVEHYPEFECLFPSKKRGQSRAIDEMYSMVKTPYIFHCEDDWDFRGNHKFIGDSMEILEKREDIHQVWLREFKDHDHPVVPKMEFVKSDVPPNVKIYYNELVQDYMGFWNGFSWNPGLRRLDDYHRMFPQGYHWYKDEAECAKHAAKFNYKAAQLLDTACHHIGWGRHI